MRKTLLLSEALCGFSMKVKHVDGTDILLKSKDIIKPGMVKTVKGKGMYDKYEIQGDLIIQFDIEFPDSLLIHQKKQIKKYLPKPDKTDPEQNMETILI
jgi:DnaJ-class molecular chaperone